MIDDKIWRDIHKLLEKQNFKNEDEMKKFMDDLMSKPIPEFSMEDMDDQELARELVFKARELPPEKMNDAIENALLLDPECIDAYELLANTTGLPEIAICFFKRGVDIGKKIFGGAYLKKHKGMFWGMHETRPFMRCMYGYADCLYEIDIVEESVAVLEEMIELNPNDNQGIRDQLMLYLIELDEFEKYKKYAKEYEDDTLAFALFNKALFLFKTEGENELSDNALKAAMMQNKFVVPKLISTKEVTEPPGFYGIGDNNEALYYALYGQPVWQETEGAVKWLKKHSKKSK